MDDRIDYIAEVIAEHYGLEEGYSNPNRTTQELVTAVGRICCDATDGKLNSKSIMLESSRTLGMGKRIPLDISNVKDYSLFPGQVNNNFIITINIKRKKMKRNGILITNIIYLL